MLKILAVATAGKKVHTHLYRNNVRYKETVDQGVNDAVDVAQFAGRCASDWVRWATTGVENGGRNA
jgi:hypothetical protein